MLITSGNRSLFATGSLALPSIFSFSFVIFLFYCQFSSKPLIISMPNAFSILHIVSNDIFFALSTLWKCTAGCSSSFRQASVVSAQVPTYVLTWRKQSPASILPSPLYPVSYLSLLSSVRKQQRTFCLQLYSLKNTLFCGCKNNGNIQESQPKGCDFKLFPF